MKKFFLNLFFQEIQQQSGAEDFANTENRKSPTLAELDPQAIGLTKTGMSSESVGNLTAGQLFLMVSILNLNFEFISHFINLKFLNGMSLKFLNGINFEF